MYFRCRIYGVITRKSPTTAVHSFIPSPPTLLAVQLYISLHLCSMHVLHNVQIHGNIEIFFVCFIVISKLRHSSLEHWNVCPCWCFHTYIDTTLCSRFPTFSEFLHVYNDYVYIITWLSKHHLQSLVVGGFIHSWVRPTLYLLPSLS